MKYEWKLGSVQILMARQCIYPYKKFYNPGKIMVNLDDPGNAGIPGKTRISRQNREQARIPGRSL